MPSDLRFCSMILTHAVCSSRIGSQSQNASPKASLARCMLVGIALFVLQMSSFEKAVSQELKVNTLKQITFHKMNYNFEQFYCLDEIVYKESRWNYKAKNPKSSASGLFQVLKSKEKDPIKQIDQGLKYINHRYNGCACTALAHHKAKGWY
jgi:hypothetical protein